MTYFYLIPVSGLLALAFAYWKSVSVSKQDPGNEIMQEIGRAVREGAMAFLTREYKVLAVFVVAVAALPLDNVRSPPLPAAAAQLRVSSTQPAGQVAEESVAGSRSHNGVLVKVHPSLVGQSASKPEATNAATAVQLLVSPRVPVHVGAV